MATFTKPSNLLESYALNAITGAGDATLVKGNLVLTGLSNGIPLQDMVSFKKTAYSAGVLQISTSDFTAVTAADNTLYTLGIRTLSDDNVKTYQIISGTGATTATIAEAFRVAITNDLAHPVTATRAGSVLTLTEVSLDTNGFQIVAPTGAVNTITTPHVNSSGSLAEVQVYYPQATAGNFARYDFLFTRIVANSSVGGSGIVQSLITYWADELDGQYGAFDDSMYDGAAGAAGGILQGKRTDATTNATQAATLGQYEAVA